MILELETDATSLNLRLGASQSYSLLLVDM